MKVCKWCILVFKDCLNCKVLQGNFTKQSEWISMPFWPGNVERKGAHGQTSLGDVEFHEQHQSVVVPGDFESAEVESWCQASQSLQLHKTVPSELGMNSSKCRALGREVPYFKIRPLVAILGKSQATQTLRSVSELLKRLALFKNSEISLWIFFSKLVINVLNRVSPSTDSCWEYKYNFERTDTRVMTILVS